MAKKTTKPKDKVQRVQSSLTTFFKPAQKEPPVANDGPAEGHSLVENSLTANEPIQEEGDKSEQPSSGKAIAKRTLLKKRIDARAASKRICNKVERYLCDADTPSVVQRDGLLFADNSKKEKCSNSWIQLNDDFMVAALRGEPTVGSLVKVVEAVVTSHLVETRKGGDDDKVWIRRRKASEQSTDEKSISTPEPAPQTKKRKATCSDAKMERIRTQVEYYLSDENLRRDDFYRIKIANGDRG